MKKQDVDKMTINEAINYSVKKLVGQGTRCLRNTNVITRNTICVYGDAHGNHCGIGWLLDEEEDELMTARIPVYNLIKKYPEKIPEVLINNPSIAQGLQLFHDRPLKAEREWICQELTENGITTTGSHFQDWINLGV